MKFLLDANISWRLKRLIEVEFPDCTHIGEVFPDETTPDFTIWRYAQSENYAIITLDNDFNELSLTFMSEPKIILLKLKNESNQVIADKLIHSKVALLDFISQNDKFVFELF